MHLAPMDGMLVFLFLFPAFFMVGLSLVLWKWPPNSVNQLYGYRTKRSMASQEAWDYAQVRSVELMRHWTYWMVIWTPLVAWRWGLDPGILVGHMLMTVGVLVPFFYVERELKAGEPHQARGGIRVWGWVLTLTMLASVFVPVTNDASEPEREAKGTLESLTWSTESEDVFIILRGDPCHYYINRGLSMGLDTSLWTRELLGREITLHVVDRPAGLNWFGSVGPVRGVVVGADTLYRTGRIWNP